MNDLYEAMGTIAAAAHANGDTIDENIRPDDNFAIQHGFGIVHKSNYMRIGKQPEEQRFEITSLYSFLSVLKRNYNESELEARANVDLSTLPPEERDRAPTGKRARRNKLRKLDEYGLIEIVGANRHREYRVADDAVTPAMTFDFPERFIV